MQDSLTVVDLLEKNAAASPADPAVVTSEKTLSYGDLAATARRIASGICKQTSRPVIALFFPMSPEFVAAYFGVQYAGRQALPLNLLLPPEQLKYILVDSGAEAVIAPDDFAPKLEPLGVKVLKYSELARSESNPALPSPKAEDISTLLYTSGTTGMPKGVVLTHRNLASNAKNSVEAMRLDKSSRLLACLPSFHTFAITGTMLAPIACGASLATVPKFDPELVLKVASGLKCDVLMMVPSMYRLVTRMQERRPFDMKHLRLAVAGGEALPDEVGVQFEKTFGIPLLQGYGQTESGPVISFNMPWANTPGTVGKTIPGVSVKIVDPDTLQDVTGKGTGEIWAKGPNIMKGYHNKPDETAKTLTSDGWLRTGDMGEVTPEGYIRITGRLREMIKVAGEMVFPAEVENALSSHPAVLEVGVAGAKDERKGEIVKAYVVLKPDQTATEEQLLQHCRGLLASYKVPKVIEFRPELPKGPTGKVMRRLLK
ncbi:MAG TPA: AMP-binding protein [Planctomycetota bacterium]|nr:AMP-binding protein [Planctomycetota bacterium]